MLGEINRLKITQKQIQSNNNQFRLRRSMAKRTIRSLKTEMPDVDIYLDDVQEIQELFRALYAQRDKPIECHFEYQFDETVICDSIHDLEQHGGHSINFKLIACDAEGRKTRVLRFYKTLKPEIDFPYWVGENRRWELKARIEDIFRPRKNRLKSAVRAWHIIVLIVGIDLLLQLNSKSAHFSWLTPLLLIPYAVILLRSPRVNFYYQRAKALEDRKERRQFWRDARIAVLGSFVGGALVLFVQYALTHSKR